MSQMSLENKEFFRQILDVLHLFYCQRAALFIILKELRNDDWESVYHVLQDAPEVQKQADEAFASLYASVADGNRDSAALKQFAKAALKARKPN